MAGREHTLAPPLNTLVRCPEVNGVFGELENGKERVQRPLSPE